MSGLFAASEHKQRIGLNLNSSEVKKESRGTFDCYIVWCAGEESSGAQVHGHLS